MRDEKLIEQMYKRLSGQLSSEEQAEFDQLVATNSEVEKDWIIFLTEQYLDRELEEDVFQSYYQQFPELVAEVSRQREVRMMLKASVQDNLRVELKEILPPSTQAPPAIVKPFYQKNWFYAVAAALVILLALPFVLRNGKNISNEELFAEHFQPLDMRMISRGTENDSLKGKIQRLYHAGNYQASLSLLEKLIQEDPENPSYRLYRGICFLGMKPPAPQQAIPIFNGLKQDLNVGQAATWYLALAYILDDKPEEGFKLAKAISQQEGHSYRKQAAKLVGNK